MHNTHLILLNAENSEFAESEVAQRVSEWGNENNYFRIERVIDLDNPTDTDKQILAEEIKYLNEKTNIDSIKKTKDTIKSLQEKANDSNYFNYFILSEEYKKLYQLSSLNGVTYAVDNLINANDYYGYQYDEYGLTNIQGNKDESEHTFLVIIDMHS